jgi:hypothetical protein
MRLRYYVKVIKKQWRHWRVWRRKPLSYLLVASLYIMPKYRGWKHCFRLFQDCYLLNERASKVGNQGRPGYVNYQSFIRVVIDSNNLMNSVASRGW